jgi:hypothetical protein
MSLLTQIDCYLRRTGIPPTTFGRRVVNDPRLVHDLRRGRTPGPKMRARVEAALREAAADVPIAANGREAEAN